MRTHFLPINYVEANGNITFLEKSFSEADTSPYALFLLQDINNLGIPKEGESGYKSFEQVVKKQNHLHGKSKYGLLLPKNINALINACAKSKRFKDGKFYNLLYIVDSKTQSSIVMCDITDDVTLVIFGSTDDSVIGWVEDIELLASHNVECLKNSKEYVSRNCNDSNKKYIFIGHSKGGMCASFAFYTADQKIRDNVIMVYDLDGPGFDSETLCNILGCDDSKVKIICPVESFVGRLFFQPVKPTVVASIDKGINQHNPTGWAIKDEHYEVVKHFNKKSSIKAVMAFNYMNSLSKKEKEHVVRGLTKLAKAGNTKTLTTLVLKPLKILRNAKKLSKEEKRILLKAPFKIIKSKVEARTYVNKREKKNKK